MTITERLRDSEIVFRHVVVGSAHALSMLQSRDTTGHM